MPLCSRTPQAYENTLTTCEIYETSVVRCTHDGLDRLQVAENNAGALCGYTQFCVIETAALLVFGATFIGVAWVSDKWTPLIGIGGLLVVIGIARALLPA